MPRGRVTRVINTAGESSNFRVDVGHCWATSGISTKQWTKMRKDVLETMNQERRLEINEMRMLMWMCGEE